MFGDFLPTHAGAGLPHRWLHQEAGKFGPQRWLAGVVGGVLLGLAGCGQQYRPVVAAISPVGPAGQPEKFAFAVSNPNGSNLNGTLSGLLTSVDVSGDAILSTPAILPNPSYFTELASGAEGFVINQPNALSAVPQSSLDALPIGNPTTLITSQVIQTTLPTGVTAPSLTALTFGGTTRIFIPETNPSEVSIFSAASPALQQQISVSANPVYVVGYDGTPRAYVISNGTSPGQVAAIEASSLSVSATIPVGANPVYGVETTDTRRAFILNAGSGTVSVINVTNNALDSANPVINLNNANGNGVSGLQPVWADLATDTNQLIVVSQRAGDANGYLSIINIPLCNAVAQPTNPSCDPTNPVDGVGFGQVLATVPVGVNPVQVSALIDGSQAFVANQGDSAANIAGSVTAVNLVSGTVTATITGATASSANVVPTCAVTAVATGATQACVYGHPNSISATTGTPTGKVYVTSPDSNFMTVIETDTDTVDTHINLQGVGVRVLVSAR